MADQTDPNDASSASAKAPVKRPLFDLRTYFLTGVVVAAPVLITIYLTYWFVAWFVTFVDQQVVWVLKMIPGGSDVLAYLPYTVPGVGVALMALGMVVLGFFTANVAGRWLIVTGERLVDRMPVVRTIYGALKQIFETVLAEKDKSFKQVALVEYPRRGMWAVSFVTSDTQSEIAHHIGEEMVSLFLPTTPNPTSGFLLFAPRRDVIILDMTVEEGAKLVISGGLVTPQHGDVTKADMLRKTRARLDHQPEAAMEGESQLAVRQDGGPQDPPAAAAR